MCRLDAYYKWGHCIVHILGQLIAWNLRLELLWSHSSHRQKTTARQKSKFPFSAKFLEAVIFQTQNFHFCFGRRAVVLILIFDTEYQKLD
jgi:hypothetical protein